MIRPLRSSDIPAIEKIYSFANESIGLPVNKDHFRKDAKKYVSETIYKCENMVYELNGVPAGIISVSSDYIEGIFVDPRFFKKGIGSALIKHFLNKKEYLQLQVYELNHNALNFYRSHGFVITGGGICRITGLPYFEMVYERK
ncbi:MAG TPA: GNAT family N-acetyltransferase [bacterium]|jgi:ribosomal protein S18 acetylase RimI-like enzyme|nr:GNAT family N-acetyltransferase [bacterium]MDX9804783.1 GNAT family N-acetyltransferase [bacterium]HNZ52737.1 GNAT family N-acetyltransferase [bacterium]HOG43228.1 GNAT family N-acetyltransferase [bacterium]HPG35058.1 GNAT family N-acetyltransferase [bacterium]